MNQISDAIAQTWEIKCNLMLTQDLRKLCPMSVGMANISCAVFTFLVSTKNE